jgi:acyl-CoA thioesterase-2
MAAQTANLLSFLDLEHIDGDIYRGRPGPWSNGRHNIYGGETAAQAVRAAAHTVDPGRVLHSMHGYFLRPGDPNRPVIFHVERDRDGRSFSARRVAAVQGGEVIWEMACSFGTRQDGPEFSQPPQVGMAPADVAQPLAFQWCPLLDIRIPPRPDGRPVRRESVDRVWVKVVVPMPDDPIIHACMQVFASDVGSGFGDLEAQGIPPGGPSIDHALWLHHPTRADDWVIWDCEPAKVANHRGLYTGTAHDLAGNLVAMIAQEMLLRPPTEASKPSSAATTDPTSKEQS